MFDSLSGILTGVLSVATILAVAVVGLMIGTVRTLRESNGDLRDRVADLEKGRGDDRAEIALLTADRDALGRVVTGEAHWVALGHQLEDHHREARTHWSKDESVLGEILETLREARP